MYGGILKRGQKAAIVIRLFYHDLSIEAEKRMLSGTKKPSANLHTLEMGKEKVTENFQGANVGR